jgi:hypothetical protein
MKTNTRATSSSSTSGSSRSFATYNIKQISQDKDKNHSESYEGVGDPFNAGVVKLKCFINAYCPVTREIIDLTLPFTSESIASLPEDVQKCLDIVPGLDGVFLKPIYNYRTNLLVFGNDEALPKETAIADGASAETWKTVPSPVDGLAVIPYSQYNATPSTDPAPAAGSTARFKYVAPPYPSEGAERADGCIPFPTQVAATPGSGSIHWKVTKTVPLFKGEDFFIHFRRGAHEVDLTNVASKPFALPEYRFLDANLAGGGGNYRIPAVPANSGIVDYKKTANVGNTVTYAAIADSGKLFDFWRQPYIVVELNGPQSSTGFGDTKLCIVFTQNHYPTFFKVIDFAKIIPFSFALGVYKEASCASLFASKDFRMTLRNHLGKMVITFSGYENKPWIIENTAKTPNEDKIFRIPNKCEISIWSGNMSLGFSFSPLQYAKSATFEIPPNPRVSAGSNSPASEPIAMPKKGYTDHYMFLSIRDCWPDELSPQGEKTKLDYRKFAGTRTPFYGHDANVVIEPGNPSPNLDAYFTNTEDKIKITGAPPSKIELEKIEVSYSATGGTIDSNVGTTAVLVSGGDESRVLLLRARVSLTAGSTSAGGHEVSSCITPIITHIRLVAIPDNKDVWVPSEIDISDNVMSFNDSWTTGDYTTTEHSGTIKFLITDGIQKTLPQTNLIEGLKDKAFYIEVWAGYNSKSYTFGCKEDPKLWKLFTGICMGGTVTQEPIKRILECKIVDYSEILKQSLFFNSPFFDGMRDVNAVNEILSMVGFKNATSNKAMGIVDPGYYVKQLVTSHASSTAPPGGGFQSTLISTIDGRNYNYSSYALPFSWDRLQSPVFKYNDGTKLYDALLDWAKKGSKMMFFDQCGGFHWEESSGITMSRCKNSNFVGNGYVWKFKTGNKHEETGQYMFNVMTKVGAVEDIYNNIHILTSTPNFELIIGDEINWPSIENKDDKGFLGFRKTFLQQESLFGNETALANVMNYYKAVWKAPIAYKFETYGQPIRAFDFVSVDGINLVVTSVSSEIDPVSNRWWQTIECEYLQKADERSLIR